MTIEYKYKYYNCNKHYKEYILYCSKCNINLCANCEKEHENHKKISLKKIKLSKKRINEINNEIEQNISKINLYKKKLKGLNEFFNEAIINASNEIEYYINLYEIMLYSLKNMNNFEAINNVNNFRAIKVNKEIESFLNENINNKIKYIINKYILETENIVYNINADDPKVKVFGEEFVKNNKDN